jgi:hypothetical protein
MQRPPLTALALPLRGDGRAYLDHLSAAYGRNTKIGDVTLLAGPLDQTGRGRGRLALQTFNDYVILGDNTEAVAAAVAALTKGPIPEAPRVMGDVRLALAMNPLLPLIESRVTQWRQHRETQPPPGAATDAITNVNAVLDAEVDAALQILRQTKSVALGFKTAESDATFYLRVDAKHDTTLAKAMACLKPMDPAFAAFLPSNTLYGVSGGGMGVMRVLAKPYADLARQICQAMPAMSGQIGPMREMLLKAADLYSGDYAIALLPDNRSPHGVLLAEVMAIADAERARDLSREQLLSMTNNNMNQFAALGLKIEALPARQHAGVEITVCHYAVCPPTNSAAAAMMPPPAAMMLGGMTGLLASCAFESAVVDRKMVVVVGRDGAIDQVIDRLRAGGDGAFVKRAQTVFGDMRDPSTMIGNLALVATLERFARAAPNLPPEQLAALPEPGEGLGCIAFHQGDSWVGALRLTASEMQALMRAAPVMRALFMQTMQTMRPAGQPPAGQDEEANPAPGKARF